LGLLYAGGTLLDPPNYYQVATGTTGFAEVVRVTFDETVIPSNAILDIYFLIHDPTTLNRQGADQGTQYRSIMLYADETQKTAFQAAVTRAKKLWDDPVVTELAPLDIFYPAEDEHQDYFNKNPQAGYCSVVIEPKIAKTRKEYTKWIKEESI
jgi:peptide-methionine (S)-S-oxide reductase